MRSFRTWASELDVPITAPAKIISGGQTGADRGGLDAAIALGIPHGGWCPRGRKSEDGTVPRIYQLRDHALSGYPARTEQNVIDSDATAIFTSGPITRGSALTLRCAVSHDRNVKHFDIHGEHDQETAHQFRLWLLDCLTYDRPVRVLNVAGSRESRSPGIQARAKSILMVALS